MTDWRYPFNEKGLNYISAKAKQINDLAALLGVPPPGIAGGIAREMTLEQNEYPYQFLRQRLLPIKELLTSIEADNSERSAMAEGPGFSWKPITHRTIADNFAR